MWTCPKCGREFKRTNQGHYCGKAPENVDEYIELQITEAREHIAELRKIIKRCVPEAKEQISWSMPVYKKGKLSISFSACNKHISLYIDATILEMFKVNCLRTKKDPISFRYEVFVIRHLNLMTLGSCPFFVFKAMPLLLHT